MEETISKVAIISIVLVALAIVSITFMKAQSLYQEAEIHMSSIATNATRKTLAVVYCFTNATSNETSIHIYNYGESNYTGRLVIFYGNESVFNSSVIFPAKEMRVINVGQLEGNPREYELILIWLESGDIEVVKCIGP